MSAAEKIVESAVAHRHSFDSLSMRARTVLLRGLKGVLDNSKTEEEFEEATALTALLVDDLEGVSSQRRQQRHGFHEHETGAPIAGFPAARPCPFCKDGDDWIGIVTLPEETDIECAASYYVQCDGCHAEGPPCDSKLEAALRWNAASDCSNASRDDLRAALYEQQQKLFSADAIIESITEALYTRFGRDWPIGVPDYPRALQQAASLIKSAYENLELEEIEERAVNTVAPAQEH